MGSASTAWKPIIKDLLSTFTVVTVDLPGHGETPLDSPENMDPQSLAKSVFETMRSQGLDRFHVVGNSLGGWVALEMAASEANSILSVTALAPAGLWLQPFTARNLETTGVKALATSLKITSPLLLRFEWARRIGFRNVSPLWRTFSYELCLDATLAMANSTGYFPAWDALLHKRFDKEISEHIPITSIFGDSDKTLPAENCQERSLLPPHATWLIFSECGHAPMWDHSKEVVGKILETSGAIK